MAKYKIVTPAGASFTVEGGGYDYEMEALQGMDAEIVECPATEEGFISGVQGADAIYAKGMQFNAKMIAALPASCRGMVLGTVGVDYVDVAAAWCSAPSAWTTSTSPPPPPRACPSPTAPTPSSRKSPTTP
jgi:D-3-phosphoglycerate dehydrogenase / 2-oxoglutarate reductase